MDKRTQKKAFAAFLFLFTATAMLFSSQAAAFNFTYKDNVLGIFSIMSSQNFAKPGDVITATVLGQLAYTAPNQPVMFHITYYVDTADQSAKVLNEQDMIIDSKIGVKTSITQILIPANVLSNVSVYATVTNGTTTFTRIIVAFIQNPTYSDLNATLISQQASIVALQNLNANLQNQLKDLQTRYDEVLANCSALQTSLQSLINQSSNLQTNNTDLRNQISTLESEKNTLQKQLSDLQLSYTLLQAQLDRVNANNTALITQIANLQDNNTNLQKESVALRTQIEDLQKQVVSLNETNSNLQAALVGLGNETETLQLTLANLQLSSKTLEKQNAATGIFMYIAIAAAVTLAAVLVYVLLFMVRGNNKGVSQNGVKKPKEKPLF